jgi:hypothetical protein
MDNGRRFTYIWTTKNTNNGRNYHRGYAFKSTTNNRPIIYLPDLHLANAYPSLKKLRNAPNTFTRQNRNNIKQSLINRNIRPFHAYIMARNILNARIRNQNAAARANRANPAKTNKQQLRVNKLRASHNYRIREWQMLKNISKNLIRHVRPHANVSNAGIQRAINFFYIPIRPGNFNSINIKRQIKNEMPSYSNSGLVKKPGSGTEYYNKHGVRHRHA